jgi:hypothetical protein
MIKKLKKIMLTLCVAFAALCFMAPGTVFADAQGSLCHGANNLEISSSGSCSGVGSGATDKFNNIVKKVLIFLSVLVGAVLTEDLGALVI